MSNVKSRAKTTAKTTAKSRAKTTAKAAGVNVPETGTILYDMYVLGAK